MAVDPETPKRILGYYTLSPGAIAFARVPEAVRKGLGRYEVPVFRLAHLAVDTAAQERGLGGPLLMAAGERCLAVATEVGGIALAIDPKDDRAATWYEGFGALKLLDSPRQLVLPLVTIAEAILAAKEK